MTRGLGTARRAALLATLALAACLLLAGQALAAAPTWNLAIAANPSAFSSNPEQYGGVCLSSSACPDNYTVLVSDVGAVPGPPAALGTAETCAPGAWSQGPAFSYQWLRNGAPISGATAATYTPKAADQGKAIQCELTAQGAGATVLAVTGAPIVPPSADPGDAPPLPSPGGIAVTGTVLPGTAGSTLSCAGAWYNGPELTYQWLRNGAPIAGASAATYTAVAADQGKAIQCEVIAQNARARLVAISPAIGAETASPPPALNAAGPELSPGALSVTVTLPPGLTTMQTPSSENHNEEWWECSPVGAGQSAVTCTDFADALAGEGGRRRRCGCRSRSTRRRPKARSPPPPKPPARAPPRSPSGS